MTIDSTPRVIPGAIGRECIPRGVQHGVMSGISLSTNSELVVLSQ